MDTLLQDLRYGFRLLVKSPGFTAVAVITLALGLGANTAIFSVVYAVLLRPLPFPEPERLVLLWESAPQLGYPQAPFSFPNLTDLTEQSQVFSEIGSWYLWVDRWSLSGSGEPEEIQGAYVSASLFTVLGVKPLLGRTFAVEEDQGLGHDVAVVSQGLWQRRLGSDTDFNHKALLLNGRSYTVVGVMPAEFAFPTVGKAPEVWLPQSVCRDTDRMSRNTHDFGVIARLKPDSTLRQAQAEMDLIAKRLQQHADSIQGAGIEVIPLHKQAVRDVQLGLLILLGAVGFVVLIICTNIANLLLARATSRQKEIAIRVSIGASRGRMVRQLLTESVLLSGLGGGIGVLLAMWSTSAIAAVPTGSPDPYSPYAVMGNNITVNGEVLGFTFAFSLLTGIVFGLVPALQASKPNLNLALKEGCLKSTGKGSQGGTRSVMVISQVALSLVLLIGAGLMFRSFMQLLKVNPGFNPENVLTADIRLPQSRYERGYRIANFYQKVMERVKGLPNVIGVGMISSLPLSGGDESRFFQIEDQPPPPAGKANVCLYHTISPDYTSTMGIPLLQGRLLEYRDTYDAPPVAVINETMARRFWPGENPLGKRITCSGAPTQEIVGVVRDVKHFGLEADSAAEMYVSYFQQARREMTLVIRTASDPGPLLNSIGREVAGVDKDQAVANIQTMSNRLSNSVAKPRYMVVLLSLFAALALILAAVGIYGVVSFSVAQRTHEIGIRMALGAQTADVLKLVLRRVMTLTFIGVAVGLVAALALTRLMSNLLYGISGTDPTTFISLSLLLIGVSVLASYVPARRAIKVSPVVALRSE